MLREELEKMKIEREQEQEHHQLVSPQRHHQPTKAAPFSSGQFKTMAAQSGGTSLDEMVAATAVVVDDYNDDSETLRSELEELRGCVGDLQESNSELRMELEKVVALAIKNNNEHDDISEED